MRQARACEMNAGAPQVVRYPSTANRSLMPYGMPCSTFFHYMTISQGAVRGPVQRGSAKASRYRA